MPCPEARVPQVVLLGHYVTLDIQSPLDDEQAWVQRWTQLCTPVEAIVDHLAYDPITITIRRRQYGSALTLTKDYPGAQRPVRAPITVYDEDALLRAAERLAYEAAISRSRDAVVLHAGAVSRNGAAFVFPARSDAGKTTLTYGLALRDYLPLCDDICPLAEQASSFFAVGCRRCGHLNPGSESLLRAAGIELDGPVAGLAGYFRPARWGDPAPVRAIISPRYQDGDPLSIRRLSMAEGAVALFNSAFRRERVSRHDEWTAAVRLGSQVPAFALTYGSLDSALQGIDTITATLDL